MRNANQLAFFLVPVLWLLGLVVSPFVILLLYSFAKRGRYGFTEWVYSFENYFRLFEPLYLKVLINTLGFALPSAILCVGLAFFLAYFIACQPSHRRPFLLFLLILPCWTNFLLRILALRVFLGFDGPILPLVNMILGTDLTTLAFNPVLVFLGMIFSYLPFALMPIYVGFEKFDFSQIEAASDMGSGFFSTLFRVVLPSRIPYLKIAFVLVFVPCLGEYLIPDLLGGAKSLLIGGLITEQFLRARDWPFGAAVTVAMVILVTLTSVFFRGWRKNRKVQA